MKSKIKDPDILKELKATSYKSLLEKDLENLKTEKELQNFFVITEHTFACGGIGPLLVVGLTPAWKTFLKEQIKASNKDFGTGECKIKPDGKTISLGLERGKAKPSAIEKSFKKNVVLKNIKPEFSILEDVVNDVLSEDETGNAIFATVKKQLAEYKSAKPNDKLNKLKVLKLSIDTWQTQFDSQMNKSDDEYKIAGSLAKLEAQLDAEVLVLNKVDAPQNANPVDDNANLFDEIRQEFSEVKSVDIKSKLHTESDLKNILKDINDVVNLVLDWNKNNPFDPKEDATIAAQRKQIDVLHFNMEKYKDFVNKRLAKKDFAESAYAGTSVDAIKKMAGFPADDKAFDVLLGNYEKIWESLRSETQKFEALADNTNKSAGTAFDDLEEAHRYYIRVKEVQKQAIAWLQKSQKVTYILPKSKQVALKKQTAVQRIILDLSRSLTIIGNCLKMNDDVAVDNAFIQKTMFEEDFKAAKKNSSDRIAFFEKIDILRNDYMITFNVMMKNKNFQKSFMEHLKNEANKEPLECCNLIGTPDILTDTTKAKALFDEYIDAKGAKSVNIGNERAKCVNLVNSHQNNWQLIIADPDWATNIKKVSDSLINDLKLDSYPRFVTSLTSNKVLQDLFLAK